MINYNLGGICMFYQKNSVEVLNDLDSNLTGLTQEEVTSRLKN